MSVLLGVPGRSIHFAAHRVIRDVNLVTGHEQVGDGDNGEVSAADLGG
jgi:hypothetical protein